MNLQSLIHRIISSILMGAGLFLSYGCVKEMFESSEENEYIVFDARINSDVTKASPAMRLSGDAGVIGYIYDVWPEEDEIKDLAPWEKLDKKVFTFDGDQMVAKEGLIKWSEALSEGSMLRIYSYAPASDENMSVSYGMDGRYTLPSLTYTSPAETSEQIDITAASADVSSNFRSNIPLAFDHILTAVKFKAGFACKVNSITLANVASTGTYTIGEGWSDLNGTQTYTIAFEEGKDVEAGDMITDGDDGNVLFMIPQTFDQSSTATVTLEYDGGENTISASLEGIEWEMGRMITYTLNKTEDVSEYIYLDLAAGNVSISGTEYAGYIYVNGESKPVTGVHSDDNRYYIYQSSNSTETEFSAFSKSETGYATSADYESRENCRIPDYAPVSWNGILWSDFITDNTSVEDVIEIWDDGANVRNDHLSAAGEGHIGTAVAIEGGRTHTRNYIKVTGQNARFDLTIDDIYSSVQQPVDGTNAFRSRKTGGIAYIPDGNTELTVNFIGDNRIGCLHIDNNPSDKISLMGTGSLTVADTDFLTVEDGPATYRYYDSNNHNNGFGAATGYISNFWNSAIGPNTLDSSTEQLYNLHIYSGTIFAGTTAAEDCTAIGGGGNGLGQVYIHGGTVTAVATTAGTAIGGGMGHSAMGGPGEIYISGGNIYAYNFENNWGIPSAAIGGGGSFSAVASSGTVSISGGYVYAYSVLGTAIGGGSSKNIGGGNANITVTGGHIVAKSERSNGIGGGTGGSNNGVNGGSAKISISGNPIIRTGSIGGGRTNNATGNIGTADITISGGDIQAQFVMAAGAGVRPSFNMSGGLIRNSDTDDSEFFHSQKNGGAVYLEDGSVKITDGTIQNCSADIGGAIYIEGTENTSFTMSGGSIEDCISRSDGGALYLKGGKVSLSGGRIHNNLADNGNGGGIFITGGNFEMAEGGTASVTGNAASNKGRGGNGGGIYVTSEGSDVTVEILSGSITDNSSDRYGGGISIDMLGHEDLVASVTIGKKDGMPGIPDISSNRTLIMGGGLYARGAKAGIVINGGRIMGNATSGYVSNPNVANEGGMVTLNGGEVTHVTVTYNNNGAFFNGPVETAQQKIVTATNSIMVVPTEFKRLGYILSGWNTRPDGKGMSYREGDILHLDSDTILYAQWTLN